MSVLQPSSIDHSHNLPYPIHKVGIFIMDFFSRTVKYSIWKAAHLSRPFIQNVCCFEMKRRSERVVNEVECTAGTLTPAGELASLYRASWLKGQRFRLLTSVWEVPDFKLGFDVDWRFSWFSSVPPGHCRDSTSRMFLPSLL
jgi:hypothetical protein